MKNLKKALAVVVALAMVMTTVVFASSFTDVEDSSEYAEAINLGVALDLFTGYEDGTFKAEGDITRAEFAAIVVRMLGQEAQADGAKGATNFTDVAADHWASGYINIASNIGIVNGYGDGNFGPEDKVTYEQAVKMIVVALGYEPAVGSAGYPVGYLTVAQQNGITTGVKGTNGVAANRGQVALLVFNSLDVPLMEQTGFGTYVDYVVQDGSDDTYEKTLLSEKLGVVKLKATVTESFEAKDVDKANLVEVAIWNSYGSKYDDEDYNDDPVFDNGESELDDLIKMDIDVGESTLKSFVGQVVTLYIAYDEDSDDDPVALYAEKYSSNDEITLASKDIDSAVEDGGVVTVEYYESDTATKTTDLTIANNSKVYINGSLVSDDVETALNDSDLYGSVAFALNNDSADEDYDTLYITQYSNTVVESVNMTTGKVVAKKGSSIIFKESNEDNSSTLYDENGQEIEWSTLQENDVLSVKEVNGDVTVKVCTLVRKTVTGSVTEIDSDSGTSDDEFTIGGEAYKVDGQNIDDSDLHLSDEGTFYLDVLGNIAYFEVSKDLSGSYAYIVDYATTGNLEDTTEIKMFTYAGEMVTLNCASTVRVYQTDGDYYEGVSYDGDEVEALLDSLNAKDTLITFSVNASGDISRINFADTKGAGRTDQDNFSRYAAYDEYTKTVTDGKFVYGGDQGNYDEDANSINVNGKKAFVTEETVIMVAPFTEDAYPISNYTGDKENDPSTDPDYDFAYDDDDYEIVSLAALEDDYTWYAVSIYDVDEDNNAGIVLIQDSDSVDLTSGTTGVAMAISKSDSKDDEGNNIFKISSLKDGEKISIATEDDSMDVLPSLGTLFLPQNNVSGAMTDYKEIATIGEQRISGGNTPDESDDVYIKAPVEGSDLDNVDQNEDVDLYIGKVIYKSGTKIWIDTNLDEDSDNDGDFGNDVDETFSISDANVYFYNEYATKASTKVTLADDMDIFDVDEEVVDDYDNVTGLKDADGDGVEDDGINDGYYYTDSDGDMISSVWVFVREYNSKVADLVIYQFDDENALD